MALFRDPIWKYEINLENPQAAILKSAVWMTPVDA